MKFLWLGLVGIAPSLLAQAPATESGRQAVPPSGVVVRDTRVDPRVRTAVRASASVELREQIARIASDDPLFAAGRALFDQPFHVSHGLGTPEMNADSCRACHQDPDIGGAGGLELNVTRFGDDGNGTYPFQNLPGGQGLSKLRPPWVSGREEYDPNTATVFEQRQTPSILGAGLIDSIPDAAILRNEDPNDLNGDGIYGVARRLDIGGVQEIGKFGWKAQVPQLRDFVMDAMAGELGITTPDDGRGFALVSDGDPVADPELKPEQVDALAHFLSRLPKPRRVITDNPNLARGEALFLSIGCATCHIPTLQGATGPVRLYSNLLLHNVMPAGFRGMAEPGAGAGFFRTPPLWGIRHTAPYMHDGSAATIDDAIDAHDGEAAAVTGRVQALSPNDRAALVLFLEHL